MATLNSDDSEIIRELVDELRVLRDLVPDLTSAFESISSGGKKATEEKKKDLDQTKKLSEAEKKAAEDAAKARWEQLSEEERQSEIKNKLAAEEIAANKQKLAADTAYNKEVEEIQKGTTKSQQDYLDRQIKYQLAEYGFQKDSRDKLQQISNAREQVETKLIDQLQKQLDESPDLQKKYGTDAKSYKLALDQEKLYKQQLLSMGRYVDSNNKIIDSTIKLNKEQESTIKKIKSENENRDKAEKSLEEFSDMLGKKGVIATGGFALSSAFDFLKAGVMGTYRGLIAYEDALLDGVRGQSVMAAMISEQQNAYAAALEKAGGGVSAFGVQLIAQAAQMALVNAPMALLAAAIGSVLAILGYASQMEAEIIKRNAELNKKRAALEDEAYKNFQQLGEASMTGARGVTGLIDDLKRVGLTIKEFDKLNKILSSNSKEIAMFGATTVEGSKKFIEVTGDLINDEMSKVFEKMGISQDAQREHAQKYMAQQSRLGLLQGKTTQDLIKGTVEYIKELDRVAALTGASRKDQEAAREAVMADRQTRAALYEAQRKLKENPEDPEAKLRVKVLEDTIRIATNLRNTYGAEVATGYQQRIASGGVTSEASAMAEQMLPELISATEKGTASSTGLTEAAKGIGNQMDKYASTIKLVPDLLNNLVPSFDKLADGQNIMAAAMDARNKFEADPKNRGKQFDENAFIDAYRKAATDPRTTNDVNIGRQTQAEAIDKQTQLLNGQLGAANQMKEAGGMFGKAAMSMLEAGRKMYNAAFKGTKGEVENLTSEINDKDNDIGNATNRQKQAQLKYDKEKAAGAITKETSEELATWNEQVKLLSDQKAVLEKKRKIQEDIVALERKAAADTKALEEISKAKLETFDAKKDQLLATKQAELDKKVKNKEFDQTRAQRELETYKKQLDEERSKIVPESDQGGLGLAFGTSTSTPAGEEAIQKALLIAKAKKLKELEEVNSTPTPTATLSRGQRNLQKSSATEDTAPEAPKAALGGVVPATIDGTTVTVGEKGKPEAIMPLDVLNGMLDAPKNYAKQTATNAVGFDLAGDAAAKAADALLKKLIPGIEGIRSAGQIQNVAMGDDAATTKVYEILKLLPTSGPVFGQIDSLIKVFSSNSGVVEKLWEVSKALSPAVNTLSMIVDITQPMLKSSNSAEMTARQFDQTKDSNKLATLNNSLIDQQTELIDTKLIKSMNVENATNEKLIISMNKVTDILPATLSQIITTTSSKTSSGATSTASGATTTAPASPPSSGGNTMAGSVDALKQAGLILKKGDVQAEGKEIDPRLIEIAKQVQDNIPGFMQFTGFNDQFHNENAPGSKHTKGKAFDFVLNKPPSKEEGAKILSQLKALGIDYAQDEYNDPSSGATGGHIHGQLNAFDGGVFEPRPGGVHVNLAEAGLREAAVPLNPGEKIRVEKSEQENNPPKKDPLSTVMATDNASSSKSDQSAEMLAALHDLMEEKFNTMISTLRDGNDITDKLLKYSQV